MPIEILIAPAAQAVPAAESASEFWKYGLPVVSLVVGILLKWLLDLFTDGKRAQAARNERVEERRDLLRARLAEAERTNLLALQKIVVSLLLAGRTIRIARSNAQPDGTNWFKAEVDPQLDIELNRLAAELSPLSVRLHTADVAGQLNMFMGAFWEALSADTAREAWDLWRQVEALHGELQRLAGMTIKALEDEYQQLGDLPSR
ncbi:hypothetical protein JY423_09310 [Stenotrophomonas maltophilia]|nr:hypothetical protein [Stenotrophomonas maltophilia]MBN4962444.1 hypothetical protein [Stenotrophomonas maltophilia]